MQDYKVHQLLYNKVHAHDDLLSGKLREDFNEISIVKDAVSYFERPTSELVFPAKSYAVAIIYSYLIKKHFGTDFYTSLNDNDLMCGNDRYFVPYSSSQDIYDKLIERVGVLKEDFELKIQLEQVAKTVEYFNLEFGLA